MEPQTRSLLFWTVCLGARTALAYLGFRFGGTLWFRAVALLIGLGLLGNALARSLGLKENKGFAGGEVYWNSAVHGLLYLVFVALASYEFPHAWVALAADVLVGIGYKLATTSSSFSPPGGSMTGVP